MEARCSVEFLLIADIVDLHIWDYMQDYMRELATCLLHSKDTSGSPGKAETASARMQQLTAEASALMARTLLDPRMHKALMHGGMDAASPTNNRLDEAFYKNLVVCVDFSKSLFNDSLDRAQGNKHHLQACRSFYSSILITSFWCK